ncbi:unnamed protein product [Hymenolepis diminuta]|uniref:C3H1-type domain-containing protein n=1 Tax=Hymenolepis diminuta TaxID=6216 RepID=A0A564YLJ3_HYMDI|nr:unnamed protein product [Hymenolepis diminuta]
MRFNKAALNKWLSSKIDALSVTDLNPLFKYICVLLSKTKPLEELKSSCVDQLYELLGDETSNFVEEMFKVIVASPPSPDDLSPERPARRLRNNRSRSRSPHRSSSGKYQRSRSPQEALDEKSISRGNNGSRRERHQTSKSQRHHNEYNPEDVVARNSSHHRSDRPHDRNRFDRSRSRKSEDVSEDVHHHQQHNQRPRCRNFDEKGFCNYGDRCKYEHGSNPVVVPAAWTAAANLFDTALAVSGTSLLPTPSANGSTGLLGGSGDPLLPSNLERDEMIPGDIPTYNPTPIVESLSRKSGHSHRPRSNLANNKNIIPIPTVDTNNAYDPTSTIPLAYEPARPELSDTKLSGDDERSGNELSLGPTTSDYTPSPINQIAGQQCSLLVTKLPWRLNDIEILREHFARFGNIVSVQTHYSGQNSQALITYATPGEAEAAYRSPDPILSNRFIRTYLHPPSNNNNSGRFRNIGGAYKGGHNKDSLGFSQFGNALLGDAQPSRLPAKLRLGQGPGGALKRTYRGDNKGGPNAPVISHTDAKTSFSSSSRRSRWRLERDENGNPISGDEEEEEQEDEDLRNEMIAGEDSAEAAILDISGGDNDDDDNIFGGSGGSNRKRLRSSEFGNMDDNFLRGRTSRNSLSLTDQEAVEAEAARKKALWERQKSIALKEHQAKLAQLEKQRAFRLHAERERMAQISQLKVELKETVASAERCTEKAFKRTLLKKANDLIERINELKQSTPLAPKRLDDAKQQKTVQQMLPDNIAAERLEKIADVKKQLAEAELELQAGECAPDRQTEIRKKITELKRQLVDLETIRPSDLAAIDSQSTLATRPHTKLDNRPRVIYVTGHTLDDVEAFRRALHNCYFHTQSFQSFTCGSEKEPVLEITFRTRDFAERALRTFTTFHGRQLTLSFNQPPCLTGETAGEGCDPKVAAAAADSSDLLHFEGDEDDSSMPMVDATVEDDFRSPKDKISLSP